MEQGNSRGAAEFLIGLITDDECTGLLEHARHGTLGQGGAGGIVRRIEHHDRRAVSDRDVDQLVHIEFEVGGERHRPVPPSEHVGEEAVQ